MIIGDTVTRKGDFETGSVRALFETRARIYWHNSRQTHAIALKSIEVVDEATILERKAAFRAKRLAETGHWKYCALHHHRLNGNGTCIDCANQFPVNIYTLGDRMPRPYDGPEIR